MNYKILLTLAFALIGILLPFLCPEFLTDLVNYSVNSYEATGPSGAAGSALALSLTFLPIFFGFLGYVIGLFIEKVFSSKT